MLKIEHFTKNYGGKLAVNDLSLHIKPGEICGFIGHNGAGKTTTIKACVGIIPATAGDIYVDGVSIRRDPIACKKKLAYIPDNPDLYEFMKGIRYLNFIADVYGVGAAERKSKIGEYAEMFGISGDLGSPIGSYSHGMKQKLAVIAAMLHSPSLLIMDEPFVGLDPAASKNLKDMMHHFTAEGGAIFFSTHVLEVAEKLCDRVAIIKSGVLVAGGAMSDVLGNESLEDVFLELQ